MRRRWRTAGAYYANSSQIERVSSVNIDEKFHHENVHVKFDYMENSF